MENQLTINMDLTKEAALARLKSLLVVQSASTDEKKMRRYVRRIMKLIDPAMVYTMDAHGNLFFTKGNAELYPTVVSHLDTVHKIEDEARVFEYEEKLYCYNPLTGKQIGTGGDDKVGIFIALEMALELPAIKCAFFSREEIGCKGSGEANLAFFENSAFVIQADRKGNTDLIRTAIGTELFSSEFSAAIAPIAKKFGYKETSGGSTDVVELKKRGVNICVFNASCGYHNPHKPSEWCDIEQVFNTLDFFRDVCINMATKRWVHVYTKPVTHTYNSTHTRHSAYQPNTATHGPSALPWSGDSKHTPFPDDKFSWGRGLSTTVDDMMDDWRVMTEYFPIEIEDVNEKEIPFHLY